ncbi:UNVERIFIED_CONTAM: hypothetical protein GTU68_037082 [Idotea baltica]|nr:hypothetical protein [Idotea baltica]
MRPSKLSEIVGQEHITAENTAFVTLLRSGSLPSLILWGPPGTGKTTLARVIAAESGLHFVRLSGVLDGVKELRAAVSEAEKLRDRSGKATLALVDEIHRFNKAQQDAFLPHVESGLLTLIGQTTDNVSFRIRNALLSRLRVFISAFIKSMRGSDPDAALYYLVRSIEAGEDPLFLSRRMIIFASEDASCDPRALQIAINVDQAVQRVGMPEAKIPLAHAATYLASCPKSNASYAALKEMQGIVAENPNLEIPKQLRNAPTETMKQLGHGSGYKYPHDFPESYVPQRYLPESLGDIRVYAPSDRGVEGQIRERLARLDKLLQTSSEDSNSKIAKKK